MPMDDQEIIALYFRRSEEAISETAAKYGGYCHSIAYNILHSGEDAQECVSDTYLAAWRAIPPTRPRILSAFLGRITRRLSLDRWRSSHAAKRGGGELPLTLDELAGQLAGSQSVEGVYQRKELLAALNRRLGELSERERSIFLCRYWYLGSIEAIAQRFGMKENTIKSTLRRTREKLLQSLREEGLL